MRTLIIEDEENAQIILQSMIRQHCPQLEVTGTANSLPAALKAIETLKPELVFLDIELRTRSGFELLEKLSHIDFKIVFTTAHEQYAIKAIKYAALDYLLKPIDIDELKAAVEKIGEKQNRNGMENIQALLSNLKESRPKKITISTTEEILYIELAEIIRCEADGGYTHLFLASKKKITTPRTLGEYDDLLSTEDFVRVHHAHLVNMNHVLKFVKVNETCLMSDGASIPVSGRKKAEVLESLSRFNTPR